MRIRSCSSFWVVAEFLEQWTWVLLCFYTEKINNGYGYTLLKRQLVEKPTNCLKDSELDWICFASWALIVFNIFTLIASLSGNGLFHNLKCLRAFTLLIIYFLKYVLFSDIGIGQSQADSSIEGLRQTKDIPAALPVSGTLSSSNPDLLQSHHPMANFSTTPGERHRLPATS